MPRSKQTAHQQLDEHRQRVAAEGMKLRELQEAQARARAELERVDDTIAAAYASEDPRSITEARQAKEDVVARVEDLEPRVAGAELRAQRARQELDAFMAENARALLEEREGTAREVADRLTRAVAEVVEARHAYEAERQHVDQLAPRLRAPPSGTTASAPATAGRGSSGR